MRSPELHRTNPERRHTKMEDRRMSHRFPISMPIKYWFGDRAGTATTREVSSVGVLIQTDEILPLGQTIQLLMDWPVPLEASCGLSLAIEGTVARTTPGGAAITISKYEYRTRAREPALADSRVPQRLATQPEPLPPPE